MILVWTCLFSALGGFLFGYDLGLIGGALLQIKRYFDIRSSLTLELIVGAAKVGATVGTFLGCAAMARYGRQRALALSSITFTLGPLIMAAAAAPWMLIVGRLVVGLGIGMSASVSPAYIAELAPASVRGALVQLYEVMLCIGMLSAPMMDWVLSRADSEGTWRVMVGLPAIPALLLAAAPLLLPESPRWLVTRNRLDEALSVLASVMRGSGWLTGRSEGRWSSGFARLVDKDGGGGGSPGALVRERQAMRDAEEELVQLWSDVEQDRNAVLERRRTLWRRRQQLSGGRSVGHLGYWAGALGRPKPPGLDPIPEESSSQRSSPSMLRSTSPSATPYRPRQPQQGQHVNWLGGVGRGAEAGLAPSAEVEADGGGQQGERKGAGEGQGERVRLLGRQAAAWSRGGLGSSGLLRGGDAASMRSLGSNSNNGNGGCENERASGPFGLSSSAGAVNAARDGGGGSSSGREGDGGSGRKAGRQPRDGGDGSAADGVATGGSNNNSKGVREGGRAGGRGALLGPPVYDAIAHVYGPLPPSAPASCLDPGSGECDRLLPPHLPYADPRQQYDTGTPESQLAGSVAGPSALHGPRGGLCWGDMPGEEPSFLRTLLALFADIGALAVGPERRALGLALGLGMFDQITASTAIINYAPALLRGLGGGQLVDEGGAMLYTAAIGAAKAVGVGTALLLVDRCGRRPLLLGGSLACAACLCGLTGAVMWAGQGAGGVRAVEAALCGFTAAFSVSWAGLYWVVVSELFSMSAKSAATSAATGVLFLTGAVTNLVFLSLQDWLGPYVFLLFAALCLAAAAFVWMALPETKGKTLAEVQAMLSACAPVASTGGWGWSWRGRGWGWGLMLDSWWGSGRVGGSGSEARQWVELREQSAGLR